MLALLHSCTNHAIKNLRPHHWLVSPSPGVRETAKSTWKKRTGTGWRTTSWMIMSSLLWYLLFPKAKNEQQRWFSHLTASSLSKLTCRQVIMQYICPAFYASFFVYNLADCQILFRAPCVTNFHRPCVQESENAYEDAKMSARPRILWERAIRRKSNKRCAADCQRRSEHTWQHHAAMWFLYRYWRQPILRKSSL
jgi:hypothetical protein